MTITSIKLDRQTFMDFGVGMPELPLDPPFEMRGIGTVVVLAGPNGSGKSRILRLLKTLLERKLTTDEERHIRSLIAQERRAIEMWEGQEAEAIERERSGQSSDLSVIRSNLTHSRSRVEAHLVSLKGSDTIGLSSAERPTIVRFVPSVPTLVDPFNTTEADASNRADGMTIGPEGAELNAPAYARRILRRALEHGNKRLNRDAGHLLPKTSEELSKDGLLELIAALLGPDITLDLDDARLRIGPTQPYSIVL